MSEVKKVPEIRFAGFTEPWMKQKAYDIADYTKGNGYSKSDLSDAGTPIILYGRLYTKYQFAIRDVDTFAWPKDDSVFSQGNEVIVPASGETAEDIARAAAVERSGILLGGDLNILRPYNFINPLFLALAISNGNPQKELSKKAQGKSVVHIHNSDIQEVLIAYPSRTEQDQIAAFFLNLDNLLTLHQRNHEKLIVLKQAMLEKMFPQNGSNVPEIRFAGFTGSWEQRKLGNICIEMLAGGDIDKEKIVEQGKYPVIANALTNDGIVGFYEHDYRVKAPAVTITGRGDVGHAKARKIDFTPVVRLLAIRTNHDVDFIENAINTLKVMVESTGVPQLTVPQLEKSELFLPPTIAEEQIIGAYLRQLDNIITLHQRKHESLKRVKAALLQKMFV